MALAGSVALGAPAAPPQVVTLGGGNLDAGRDLAGAEAKLKALNAVGAGICRVPVSQNDYWGGSPAAPHPERLDQLVLLAHKHGITPMLLFEYYTRWNGELGGREKWEQIGRAFAGRFRPNSEWLRGQGIRDWGISFYSAINEPEWKDNNPTPIPPEAYAAALEGLADGVHAVDAGLKVSPGGFQEVPLFQKRDPYVKAVAGLYNQGKLFALDIHRYWDVQYVPMAGSTRFSLQSQFDEVKRDAGITADIAFYTTEMNFKKRLVSEEQAAAGLLTALWDALGVVGSKGQRVNQFVMPWNLFNTPAQDAEYGMAVQLSPWTPTARGKVVRLVGELARGMRYLSCDPKGKGEFVLVGDGRKLWVWQDRKGWTPQPGESYTVTGIPKAAKTLAVHGWDGLLKTIPLAGRSSVKVDGLRLEETWMFLAK
jgi:hypothetical protein